MCMWNWMVEVLCYHRCHRLDTRISTKDIDGGGEVGVNVELSKNR